MAEEYLTIKEAAELCRVKPDTIKDRMRRGVYKLGFHYFRPGGIATTFQKERCHCVVGRNRCTSR
jgi:hypothetical protein